MSRDAGDAGATERSWQRFREDIEAQFNPGLAVANAVDLMAVRHNESLRTRRELRHDGNLRYGAGPRQVLDIFHVDVPARAVLVFLHGGFWRGGDKSDASWVARPFVANGVPVFILNYDLCPDVPLQRIVAEIAEGIDWIRRHAGDWGYPERLFLFGHSAGAHLAAMVLLRTRGSRSVIGAALASGIYDLEPLLHISVNADLRLTGADVADLSPMRQPSRLGLPVLMSVGGLEPAGWRSQTFEYQRVYQASENEIDLFDCSGENHMSLLHRHLTPDCAMHRRMLKIIG